MIEILDSPLHVGAYRFTGQLTGDDYDACIADGGTPDECRLKIATIGC